MGSWRPKLPGFGEGSQDSEPGGGGRGLGRGFRGRGGSYHQQLPQGGRGTGYYQHGRGSMFQPRGVMMSQRWQPVGPAAGYLDQGQAYREVQPPHYYGGGRGGHGASPSAIAPELCQAMETSHEPDNFSPEAGSPDLSRRASIVEVMDQLKDLSIQDESSTCQDIVQAFPVSSNASKFPHRPGSGSIGTRCLVKANHFFAELPDKDLHQYDVAALASEVGPRVAASCASAALSVLTRDDSRMQAEGIYAMVHATHLNYAAATKSKLFADQEEREIQRLFATIINHQVVEYMEEMMLALPRKPRDQPCRYGSSPCTNQIFGFCIPSKLKHCLI